MYIFLAKLNSLEASCYYHSTNIAGIIYLEATAQEKLYSKAGLEIRAQKRHLLVIYNILH